MVCRRELPAIDRLAGEYEGRAVFVAPAVDSSLAGATAVAESVLPSGKVLWGLDSTKEILSSYGFNGVPSGTIVAADGSIAFVWSGPESTDEMQRVLDSLLVEVGGVAATGS